MAILRRLGENCEKLILVRRVRDDRAKSKGESSFKGTIDDFEMLSLAAFGGVPL